MGVASASSVVGGVRGGGGCGFGFLSFLLSPVVLSEEARDAEEDGEEDEGDAGEAATATAERLASAGRRAVISSFLFCFVFFERKRSRSKTYAASATRRSEVDEHLIDGSGFAFSSLLFSSVDDSPAPVKEREEATMPKEKRKRRAKTEGLSHSGAREKGNYKKKN